MLPRMSSPSRRILLLFAHPAPHKSRVNRRLVTEAEHVDGVTVRHLYEIYPDFLIDVREEQRLLENHEVIVFQHPMYWYSAPSLVKEWMDLVLEHGWAYGTGGCGEGRNHHTVREFLLPFEQSARLCGMDWREPFVVHGTADLKQDGDIDPFVHAYRTWLESVRDGTPEPQPEA